MRLVAIGDSTVEGLEDRGPDGRYVGWADRLARRLADEHPGTTYANLAVRGLTARRVRETQLDRAVALRPDIAVVVAGVNDLLRPRFDAAAMRGDILAMHQALHRSGATVLTFTMPDMSRIAPLARLLGGRIEALNAIVYESRSLLGTVVADLAAEPLAGDPALWHTDRLHANSEGHRRIAAALAESLGLPVDPWRDDLPPAPRAGFGEVLARELGWTAGHLAPWVWRHLRGRSSGDGVECKRPELAPVTPTMGLFPDT